MLGSASVVTYMEPGALHSTRVWWGTWEKTRRRVCIASGGLHCGRPNFPNHMCTTATLCICIYPVSESPCGGCTNAPKATPHIQNRLPDVLHTPIYRGGESNLQKTVPPCYPLRSFEVNYFHPSAHLPRIFVLGTHTSRFDL